MFAKLFAILGWVHVSTKSSTDKILSVIVYSFTCYSLSILCAQNKHWHSQNRRKANKTSLFWAFQNGWDWKQFFVVSAEYLQLISTAHQFQWLGEIRTLYLNKSVLNCAPQASPSPSPVGYSPMTPGAPSPGGYNPHTPGSNIDQASNDWVTTDIMVRVKDTFLDGGVINQTGIIRSVTVSEVFFFVFLKSRMLSAVTVKKILQAVACGFLICMFFIGLRCPELILAMDKVCQCCDKIYSLFSFMVHNLIVYSWTCFVHGWKKRVSFMEFFFFLFFFHKGGDVLCFPARHREGC